MRKIITIVLILGLFMMAGINVPSAMGPAPNSGDGVSDGSGLESPFYNGDSDVDSHGPSLCAGDGIPDSSCF